MPRRFASVFARIAFEWADFQRDVAGLRAVRGRGDFRHRKVLEIFRSFRVKIRELFGRNALRSGRNLRRRGEEYFEDALAKN